MGPGVLALPLSFALSGPATGALVLALVAAQGLYCMWLIAKVRLRVGECTAETRTYAFEDLGDLAFGKLGRRAIQACVLAEQLGVCSVFISLVGENIQAAANGALHRWEAVFFAYLPCLGLALLPDLSSLWPLSGFGVLAMLLATWSAIGVSAARLADGAVDGGRVIDPWAGPSPSTYQLASLPSGT